MTDDTTCPDKLPQRLCSEIQLFDLCDLDSCKRKIGRFCTDSILLNKFEKISENEVRVVDRYLSEEMDDEVDDIDDYDEDGEYVTADTEADGDDPGEYEY